MKIAFNSEYWTMLWWKMRKEKDFIRADELKEMMRRMGYEMIARKDGGVESKAIIRS